MFNDFFISVFTEEDWIYIPQCQLESSSSRLTEITITPAIVLNKLKQLNPTKSPGPEGWQLLCLKESASELCIPLSILFNKLLDCSTLQDLWKKAFITPVFKRETVAFPVTIVQQACLHLSVRSWNPSSKILFKNTRRLMMWYHLNNMELLLEDPAQLTFCWLSMNGQKHFIMVTL